MNDRDRHNRAAHCMQAGVKLDMARRGITDPEHMQARVGINMALRAVADLANLLIAKGLITEAEHAKALADGMETEVRMYEAMLTKAYGGKSAVHLVGAFGGLDDEERTS
jgi:hypothetical protein